MSLVIEAKKDAVMSYNQPTAERDYTQCKRAHSRADNWLMRVLLADLNAVSRS
jgi:hypothetical protein